MKLFEKRLMDRSKEILFYMQLSGHKRQVVDTNPIIPIVTVMFKNSL